MRSGGRRGRARRATMAASGLLFALLICSATARADTIVCGAGAAAGGCSGARGVAVDRKEGLLYVSDRGNLRVDVFDVDATFTFLRAFGWDVVSSGPGKVPAPDEEQSVTLGANTTGGTFTLSFGFPFGKVTAPIAFDAPASSVEAALNALASIGDAGGAVNVSGPAAGPYTVSFGGSFSEDGVAQMSADSSGLMVSGGEKSAKVATLLEGGAFEVCVPAAGDACKAGSPGPGRGQFTFPLGIAVDNDEASPAFGNVYVLDEQNSRVQRFHPDGEFVLMLGGKVNKTKVEEGAPAEDQNHCPIDSGDICQAGERGTASGRLFSQPKLDLRPGGIVHVADGIGGGNRRVQKFDPLGVLAEQCAPLPPGDFGENLRGFAVESSGGFYLASGGGRPVQKYDAGCAPVSSFHPSYNIEALAVDPSDNLFVADSTEAEASIYEYDSSATLLRVFYGDGTLRRRAVSLAPYSSATGDIFAAESPDVAESPKRVLHVGFPPPGPVVHPHLSEAKPIGNTKATLKAGINPEGKASTYHFEYVNDAIYQKDIEELGPGHGFDHAETTTETGVVPPADGPGVLLIEPLFRLASASAPIGCLEPTKALVEEGKCLAPETEYHFRAVATNGDGKATGPEASFVTEPPFEILTTWATKVGSDAARVHAQVNPLGIAATAHFEYVEEQKFKASGFTEATSTPEAGLGSGEGGVAPSAQLHSLKAGATYRYRVVVTDLFLTGQGPDRAFTTSAVPAAKADDCPNAGLRVGPSAALPDCRAYEMVSPPDKEGGEIAGVAQSAAVVPAQGRGVAYPSLQAFGDAVSAPFTSDYIASRHSLEGPEEGWSTHGISPPREGSSIYDILSIAGQYKAFSEDLRWGWLRTDSEPRLTANAIRGYANLYRRDNATGDYEAICPVKPPVQEPNPFIHELQGFSADGEIAVFRANDKLTKDAAGKAGIFQLYGCVIGQPPRVLGVLPPARGGEANPSASAAGTRQSPVGESISDSVHNALAADGSRLYWTDSGTVSEGPGKIYLRDRPFASGGECAGPEAPCTVAVSEAVGGLGADERARFWTAAPDGSVAIFSFTAEALAGNLYEFDAETKTPSLIAEGVSGVAGFSEDASRLYVVSTRALALGAVAGKANLYLYEAGEGGGFSLVATLASGGGVGGFCAIDATQPSSRCTRATPDGSRLAFMSDEPLTGYDNTDAVSGEADAEVFLYDSTANGGAGELLCVSCNPRGERPSGRLVLGPGASGWNAAQIPSWRDSFYAPRVISTGGRRLFFEATDALVPQDTNGAQDVYQWEEAGEGDCDAKDANYFAGNGGCLSLISSGESPRHSEFLDASADGSDIFFRTAESLWPEDPGLRDIYDARIEGGFPPPRDPKPPCEGETCQSPPAPPQASSPSSSSFRGPKPKQKPSCPRGKRKAGRGGKQGCAKKQKKGKRQRRRHNRRATR